MRSKPTPGNRFTTTVGKELIVGVTGILLVGFVLGHLAGNLLLLLGPEAFNDYAEKLQSLGELLWVARIGLIVALVAHVSMAISLALASRQARGEQRYEVEHSVGRKSVATRFMVISGVTILAFLLFHIYDFSISGDIEGPGSVIKGMGEESMGLYGVVFNSFANPLRSLFYIIAVCGVGLHLSHAIASVVVTLGILTEKSTDKVEWVARVIGLAVAIGFSSIPIYVFIRASMMTGA